MWERGFEQGDGRGKVRLLGGWGSVVGGGAFVVWLVFRPFSLTWSQVFGAAVGLSVAELLLRRWGWARRWGGRIPSPGRVVGALVSRVGVSLPLSGSRWGRARSVAVGFLLFGSVAGIMGWEAGQENQLLHDLREHGRRAEATVVAIAGRSEEGWPNYLAVRFVAPSGVVEAHIDVGGDSGRDLKPGGHVPVVYDPSDPSEVRHADFLGGSDAGGLRLGSVLFGLLAAGFLVGTVREVVRVKEQTGAGETPDSPRTGA